MIRLRSAAAIAFALLLASADRPALAQHWHHAHAFPGLRQADIHNPFSPRFHPLLPNTFRAVQFGGFCPPRRPIHGCWSGSSVVVVWPSSYSVGWWGPSPWGWNSWGWGGWGWGGWGWGWNPGGWGWNPWGWGWNPWGWGNRWIISSGSSRVIFLSSNDRAPGRAAAPEGFAPPADAAQLAGDSGRSRLHRAADLARQAKHGRSARLLAAGDEAFRQRRFDAALLSYRKAATADPASALPRLRRAVAHVALDRYDLAAKSIREAVERDPELASGSFRLHEIYGAQTTMQRRHCDQLLAAARRSSSEDIALVAGAMLTLSNRREDARDCLDRAVQSPEHAQYASAFLVPHRAPVAPASRIARASSPSAPVAPVSTLSQRLDP